MRDRRTRSSTSLAAVFFAACAVLGCVGCGAGPSMASAPRVESALFRGLWLSGYAPVAEARCWGGFQTSRGTPPRAPVPFYLSVGAAGEVTRVEPDLGALQGAELPDGFTECLAQIIRGMRFPPSGEPYVARVQVYRPRPASRPAP